MLCCTLQGVYGQLAFLSFSMSVATSRLMHGGAIPLSIYKFSYLVGFKHPIIIRPASFMAISTFLVCTEFLHTGQAYSAVEKHSAIADIRNVSGSATHLSPTNFRIIPFLVFTFFCVFSQ